MNDGPSDDIKKKYRLPLTIELDDVKKKVFANAPVSPLPLLIQLPYFLSC